MCCMLAWPATHATAVLFSSDCLCAAAAVHAEWSASQLPSQPALLHTTLQIVCVCCHAQCCANMTRPGLQMLERESNKEKNLEKALKEAKAKARREAAAKSSAATTEDAADIDQVCPGTLGCTAYAPNAGLICTNTALSTTAYVMQQGLWLRTLTSLVASCASCGIVRHGHGD